MRSKSEYQKRICIFLSFKVSDTKNKLCWKTIPLFVSPKQQLQNYHLLAFSSSVFDVSISNCLWQIHFSACLKKNKNILHLMWIQLSMQLSWEKERCRSVLLTWKWSTMQMLLLPLTRQTHICYTMIVRQKYGSYIQTLHSSLNKIVHVLTPTTRTSNFSLSSLCRTLNHFKTIFNTIPSAWRAMTGKTHSTPTVTTHVRPVVTVAIIPKLGKIEIKTLMKLKCKLN